MRYAEIMAGGSGTRLWPMSRAACPKQLIRFIGGKSLLEVAADRLQGLVNADHQYICTSETHRQAIREILPRFSDRQILGEPVGRDTLNAVGLAAAIIARQDPDAVIAVFTADHLIEPVDVFVQRVREGFEIAEAHPESLVTFGIKPDFPATGFGYVRLGDNLPDSPHARHVREFREKPDTATAEKYVQSGQYLWNSGMFVWRATTLLDCIHRYQPEVHAGLMKIAEAWNTPHAEQILREVYPTLTRISVDFAIMEPAGRDDRVNVVTVEMPVRWLDVGSWTSYAEIIDSDEHRNATAAAKTLMMDTKGTLIASLEDGHLIATIGVEDLVIVHTPHATLICHRDHEQHIKQLHEDVKKKFGEDYV